MKFQEVQSYKDCNGNKVKIGDFIAEVNYDRTITRYYGKVTRILKNGFYVHPQTIHTNYKEELWGKFTVLLKEE